MKPDPNVGTYVDNPNYDVSLEELTTDKKVGLILCNQQGVSDRRGLQESYMPRTSMQLSPGGNSYDNMEMPYSVEVQTSMIGGRGIDEFVKDKTRYADAYRMDTSSMNPILGPALIKQIGYKDTDMLYTRERLHSQWATMDPNLEDPSLIDGWMQTQITGTKVFRGMQVFIKGFTGDQTIWYDLWAGDTNPTHLRYSAVLRGNGLNGWHYLNIPPVTITNKLVRWWFQPGGEPSPGGGFTGRIFVQGVVDAPGVDTYFTWFGSPIELHWEDECIMCGLTFENDTDHKFFEYKRGLYMVKRALDRSGSAIYRNGYRGMALPNTGAKEFLKTQYSNLPIDSLKGCVALITNGPGEMERQNWREIVGNTTSDIRVSTPWNVTHTADTEYVILGTNIWTQVANWVDLSTKIITDVIALEDYVVFAFGDDANIAYYREAKNSEGEWGGAWYWNGTDADRFHFLSLTQDGEGKLQLWGANANSCKATLTEPPPFSDFLGESPTWPVFDIWKEERFDLQLTIDRLSVDIPASEDPDEQTRLTRMKEDAIRERDRLLTYIKIGDTSSHITNMVIYGSPGIPYLIKETEVGSIYENVYSKIPIAEIESVRSEINGRAAMAYGVYLYFNLEGGWIERYYDQQMNDVSPNQNEGLPPERQGEISKLMPYAGRWYASINAGFSGISSVLLNNELGWHEIYRSPSTGMPITDIYVQAIPGVANADLLWIAENLDIISIPIAISPLKQKNYTYHGLGLDPEECPYVETAWIDFNYKDVNKYFNSLKLFVDMPGVELQSGYEYQCHVWFRTDMTGKETWIYAGSRYAKEGSITDDIMSFPLTYQGKFQVWGKQIKFKIAMQSAYAEKTPRLKAWVCDAVIRFEVKKSWSLTFQLNPDTDLNGVKVLMDRNEIYSLLDKWANSNRHAIPLRMRTNEPESDNKMIFIDPATVQRKTVELSTNKRGAKKEFINIASVIAYEV